MRAGLRPLLLLLFLLPLLFLPAVPGLVKLCPSHCLCYESSDLVDCQARGLSHVPHGIPHGTWLLDLSRNQLEEVRSGSFTGLWSLKVLLLSNNSLGALRPQALSSLQFLERLDLSFNRLRGLPASFSQHLSSLLLLRLDHNLLQHLGPPSLDQLENLQKLDLSYNCLWALEVGVFRGLSRLTSLNLEGNNLSVVQGELFSRQQNLEILLLNHNNISTIESDALTPLRTLALLGLQGNQLQQLRIKTFLKIHTTISTHLQLSLNPWTCDCDLHRVFSKILRIRYLHVDDYQDIVCHAPPQQAGFLLSSMDSQLCMAETATVLGITITVMLAVVCAMVKAERNSKRRGQEASEAEAQAEK